MLPPVVPAIVVAPGVPVVPVLDSGEVPPVLLAVTPPLVGSGLVLAVPLTPLEAVPVPVGWGPVDIDEVPVGWNPAPVLLLSPVLMPATGPQASSPSAANRDNRAGSIAA